jgi:hypothetical protein
MRDTASEHDWNNIIDEVPTEDEGKAIESPTRVAGSVHEQSREEEISQLRSDLKRAEEQIGEKNEEIVRLCSRQASLCDPAASEEFHSASATPFPSLAADGQQPGSLAATGHGAQRGSGDQVQGLVKESPFNSSTEAPYVKKMRDKLADLHTQWEKGEKAENRAAHFEKEHQRMMKQCASLTVKLQRKGDGVGSDDEEGKGNMQRGSSEFETDRDRKEKIIESLRGKVEKAETKAAKILEHSKAQSERMLMLQNEAKVQGTILGTTLGWQS